MTLNNQQFLLHQDQDIIIFGTQQNLQILAQSATIYMDGTFKSAPEMFTQLYTIHATYRDHVIPAIYTLLTDKTQTTYHRVIDIIRQKMADSNLVFNPQTIISDFESALIPTIRQQFPNTLHHGCYFHHTQALW